MCQLSTDCAAGFACVDGHCIELCEHSIDCPQGEICRLSYCVPDDYSCSGDQCWNYTPICEPGAQWCDETGPHRCSDEGLPVPLASCAPGTLCIEGDCMPLECGDAENAVCVDDYIVVCDQATQRVGAVVACDAYSFQCVDGSCVPRTCMAGERRCEDDAVWECLESGRGWRRTRLCSALELCEAGACVSMGPCSPGERRCDGETVVECRNEYFGYEEVVACEGYCEAGACQDAACAAGMTWCSENRAHSCDARGSRLATQDCGEYAVCDGGQCNPRICTGDVTRCDSGSRVSCSSDGTRWLDTPCSGADICVSGECLPEGTTLPDGAPCDDDAHCIGGACLLGPQFPGGYCTTPGCSGVVAGGCPGGGICLTGALEPYCAQSCIEDEGCRGGYRCIATASSSADRYCRSVNDLSPFGPDFPFFTTCESTLLQANAFDNGDALRSVEFMLDEGDLGVLLTLFHLGGASLAPREVSCGDYQVHEVEFPIYQTNSELVGEVVPLLLPASPAHREFLSAGVNVLSFSTPNDAVCTYMIPIRPEGRRIDLNVILVGLQTDEMDGSLNKVFERVDEILSASGFELGVVRTRTATDFVARQYQILRSIDDLQGLVSTGRPPGPSEDEALSLDVFLVRDMVFDAGSVIGLSSAMPGAAGLHGFPGSGVAVAYTAVEEEPDTAAQVLVHEMGHFMGLAHTTETWGESLEPLSDTPECPLPAMTGFPLLCPDYNNLMFPYVVSDSIELSEEQRWVLQLNPLTKL